MTQAASHIPREIENAVENMPAISPVLGKINKIAQEMETSPRDLVKIIMLDPILTGKVLKLVNSSFYGLTQKVQTLAQAVVYLGVNTVKNLAISTALLSTVFVREKQSPLDPDEFWRHCLATALGSKLLAKLMKVDKDDLESYFIAGLLHDVGKVLLIRTDPARYAKALSESRKLGVTLAFAEAAHFGISHTQAGGLLARRWKLDPFLISVIEDHHSLVLDTDRRVQNMVVVVNNLCKATRAGESGNCVVEEMADDIVMISGLNDDMLNTAADSIPEEVEKAADFLTLIREQGDE